MFCLFLFLFVFLLCDTNLQEIKRQAFYQQIAFQQEKCFMFVFRRITLNKKDFKFDFTGCYPMFIKFWLGCVDGMTKFGLTVNLNANTSFTQFNTGTNTPQWFFWDKICNKGYDYSFKHEGNKYRVYNVVVRTVGKSFKVRAEGKFKVQCGNSNLWVTM